MRYYFSLAYIFLLLISCGETQSITNGEQKRIIPEGTESIILETPLGDAASNNEAIDISQKSIRSFVPQDYIILEYVKENLNGDDTDEDIVLYTTYSVDVVYVFIASFDSNANTYRFIWQAPTNVVSENPLSLSIRDITGDLRKEIIVRGLVKNEDAYLQSIEVFHMFGNTQYDIAKYRKVFEDLTNSDIDIDETLQEQDSSAPAHTKSFPIILYNVNQQTKDIVKTFYRWDPRRATYISYKSIVFSRAEIIKKQIDSLYYGSTKQWLEYLQGMWRRVESDEHPTLLYFSSRMPHINIYSQKKLQAMQWLRTVRTIDASGLGAQIYVRNMVLSQIKKWIRIRIIDDETLDVYLGDDITGAKRSGRYTAVRNSEEIAKQIELFSPTGKSGLEQLRQQRIRATLLRGSFEDAQTKTLYAFQYPRLNVVSAQARKQKEFYFTVFTIGAQQILQLKNIESLHEQSEFYAIENTEAKILLKPVQLSFHTIYANTAAQAIDLTPITQNTIE